MALKNGSLKVRAGLALAVGALAFTTACGSDASSDGGDAAPAADLGTKNPATEDAVKVGFVYTGRTAAIDASKDLDGAQAAADYADDYLGGVGGHKIELVPCETGGTPAGATTCGNQMVKDDVAIVVTNTDGNPQLTYAAVAAAGIPYFVYSAGDPAILGGENAFVLTDTIATQLAGPAMLAKDEGFTKAAVMALDVPASTGPINALAPGFYEAAGAALDIVPVPVGAADLSPQVQIALTKDPDQIALVGPPAFCTSALKAIRTLGYEGTVVGIQQCIDTAAASSIPGGYEGLKIFAPSSTDPTDPEVATYIAALKAYAPDLEPFGGTYRGAYAMMIALARVTADSTGDVTEDSLIASLSAAADVSMPLATGQTFTCDGKANPFGTAICAAGGLLTTLDADGAAGEYTAVDVSSLYAP